MAKRPVLVLLGAVVLLAAVTWILSRILIPHHEPPEYTFWYDTGTRRLFPASPMHQPPIPAPSGADGVRAFVFSATGNCNDTGRLAIGYLLTLPVASRVSVPIDAAIADGLIRREHGTGWVRASSKEGEMVLAQFRNREPCLEYRRRRTPIRRQSGLSDSDTLDLERDRR